MSNKNAAAPVKKKRGALGIVYGFLIAVGAIAILPTTLIFVIGMIPTAVAYFVDTSRSRTLGPTVCFLNACGVMPALFTLWEGNHTINAAIDIISNPTVILVMLLPAALGWVLFGYMPVIVGGILRHKAAMRIRSLEKEQQTLVNTWGPSVKNLSADADKEVTEQLGEDEALQEA